MGTVVVVGGVNQDVTVQVDRRPAGGETVVGRGPVVGPGGKAANQAAAAAHVGARVLLCAVVGDDDAGRRERARLVEHGIDATHVRVAPGTATGAALIVVTPDGENSIVVGAGANALLADRDVAAAVATGPDVVLVQTEPGPAPAEAAAEQARRHGARLVTNAAPTGGLSAGLLRASDPLVVNEHEARDLLREHGAEVGPEGADLAAALRDRLGCRSVVVSLGAEGAVVTDDGHREHLRAPRVRARDTTGAGDVLVGVVAARLSQGADLVTATRDACALAATAVTSPGARGYLGEG